MTLRGRRLGWLTFGYSTVSILRHFQRRGAQIGLLHSFVQLCPTVCNPTDFSTPGSSVHGTSRQEYWSGLPFPLQGIFSTQGSNLHLLYWSVGSLQLNHQGSPRTVVSANSLNVNLSVKFFLFFLLTRPGQGPRLSYSSLVPGPST